jgi:hypothetical protein
VSFASSLATPWQKWPIVEGDAFDQQTESATRLPIGGLFIPVEIERVVRREMASATVAADRNALESYHEALEDFLKQIRENCSGREAPYLLLDGSESFEDCFLPLLSRSGMIG